MIISLFRMAPIQRQRRRGLHTVHQVRLQQFRKSVLRLSTTTDSIGQTVPGTRCSSSKGTVAERRVHSDHFQHLTSSTIRVPERRLPAQQQSVMRYSGARSFRHLCTSIAILYCMRSRTGSQWRTFNTGVIRSERRVPVTRRAAAF